MSENTETLPGASDPILSSRIPDMVQDVHGDNVFKWLAKGWEDMRANLSVSLIFGFAVAIGGWLITWLLIESDMYYLGLPMAMSFSLMGPLIATGLYEISRRRQNGEQISFESSLFKWRSPIQVLLMGALMLTISFAWIRFGLLIFMLFFGIGYDFSTPGVLLTDVFTTVNGFAFLVVGSAFGAIMAAITFALSVVTIPFIVDKDVDVATAAITSLTVVKRNWQTMMFWGIMISLLTFAGLVTGYLGLIIVFPLLGHATWHCYQDCVKA